MEIISSTILAQLKSTLATAAAQTAKFGGGNVELLAAPEKVAEATNALQKCCGLTTTQSNGIVNFLAKEVALTTANQIAGHSDNEAAPFLSKFSSTMACDCLANMGKTPSELATQAAKPVAPGAQDLAEKLQPEQQQLANGLEQFKQLPPGTSGHLASILTRSVARKILARSENEALQNVNTLLFAGAILKSLSSALERLSTGELTREISSRTFSGTRVNHVQLDQVSFNGGLGVSNLEVLRGKEKIAQGEKLKLQGQRSKGEALIAEGKRLVAHGEKLKRQKNGVAILDKAAEASVIDKISASLSKKLEEIKGKLSDQKVTETLKAGGQNAMETNTPNGFDAFQKGFSPKYDNLFQKDWKKLPSESTKIDKNPIGTLAPKDFRKFSKIELDFKIKQRDHKKAVSPIVWKPYDSGDGRGKSYVRTLDYTPTLYDVELDRERHRHDLVEGQSLIKDRLTELGKVAPLKPELTLKTRATIAFANLMSTFSKLVSRILPAFPIDKFFDDLGKMATEKLRDKNRLIIVMGGADRDNNFSHYYDTCIRYYNFAVNVMRIPPKNIVILFADGTNPAGDQPTKFVDSYGKKIYKNSDFSEILNKHPETRILACTKDNYKKVLKELQNAAPDDKTVFLHFDHGFINPKTGRSNLCLYNGESIDSKELGDHMKKVKGYKTIAFAQCHAGGMAEGLDYHDKKQCVITISSKNESSYGASGALALIGGFGNDSWNTYQLAKYAYKADEFTKDSPENIKRLDKYKDDIYEWHSTIENPTIMGYNFSAFYNPQKVDGTWRLNAPEKTMRFAPAGNSQLQYRFQWARHKTSSPFKTMFQNQNSVSFGSRSFDQVMAEYADWRKETAQATREALAKRGGWEGILADGVKKMQEFKEKLHAHCEALMKLPMEKLRKHVHNLDIELEKQKIHERSMKWQKEFDEQKQASDLNMTLEQYRAYKDSGLTPVYTTVGWREGDYFYDSGSRYLYEIDSRGVKREVHVDGKHAKYRR